MKIGIDPGINGAIAVIFNNGTIYLYDMPVCDQTWSAKKTRRTKAGKIKKDKYGSPITYMPQRVDAIALTESFKALADREMIDKITIEVVHSMPTDGVRTAFSFGCSFGSAISVALNFCEELNYVYPAVWKTKFGLIHLPKDASRQLALKLYPELDSYLKRKKDIDRADALFIGIS